MSSSILDKHPILEDILVGCATFIIVILFCILVNVIRSGDTKQDITIDSLYEYLPFESIYFPNQSVRGWDHVLYIGSRDEIHHYRRQFRRKLIMDFCKWPNHPRRYWRRGTLYYECGEEEEEDNYKCGSESVRWILEGNKQIIFWDTWHLKRNLKQLIGLEKTEYVFWATFLEAPYDCDLY